MAKQEDLNLSEKASETVLGSTSVSVGQDTETPMASSAAGQSDRGKAIPAQGTEAPDKECNDASSETVNKTDKVAWMTIIMLGMLAAFGPVCTDIYLPAIPVITEELHSDPAAIQLSLTTSLLGLALGQLFIGPLSDAMGRKKPLYISLIVFAISSLGCAFASTVPQLVIARLFQGLAGAGGIVLSRTIACDMYSGPSLTKFMALLMTVNGLAPILGPIIGSSIVTFFDWPMLFVFLAVWGVLLFGGSISHVQETLPQEKRAPHLSSSIKDMLHQLVNLRFLLLSLSLSFVMGGFFGYLSASPFVFQKIFGMSPLGYAVVFAINAIGIAIFSNIAARVAQKISDKIIVKFALIIQLLITLVLGAMVMTGLLSMILVALCLCIYVGMMGVAQTAGFGLVMGARSGGAGSASGIFGVLTFLFGAMFSPLVGLQGEMSMVPLVLCMLASCICAYLCFVIGLRIKTQHDVEIDLHAPEGHVSDTKTRPVFHKEQKQASETQK